MNKRLIAIMCSFVLVFLLSIRLAVSAEVTFYDDGPLEGLGLPFSESVRVGDLLFLSGMVGVAADGKLVAGGIAAETHQIFTSMRAALERRDLGFADVVKCTVFLTDIAEWPAFNEIYKEYFKAPYPARSALAASGLALGAQVEVECIAAYR